MHATWTQATHSHLLFLQILVLFKDLPCLPKIALHMYYFFSIGRSTDEFDIGIFLLRLKNNIVGFVQLHHRFRVMARCRPDPIKTKSPNAMIAECQR